MADADMIPLELKTYAPRGSARTVDTPSYIYSRLSIEIADADMIPLELETYTPRGSC